MFTNETAVTVFEAGGKLVTTSRNVAEVFEKEHFNVIRDINNLVSQNPKLMSLFISSTYRVEGQSRLYPEYLLTRDGVTLLTMGFNGSKAMAFKLKYIDAFNRMEAELTNRYAALPDFNDPVAAARAWADVKELEMQALDKVKELTPKAEYYDELVDRNLLTTFRETAKELQTKERDFINWLIDRKLIYRSSKNKLLPYAKDNGFFEVKERFNPHASWAGTQTMITPKGREAFLRLYR